MKKFILGIATMFSGVLLICAALIGGGAVASAGSNGLDSDIADSGIAVIFLVIGAIITLSGATLSITEAFKKTNNVNKD